MGKLFFAVFINTMIPSRSFAHLETHQQIDNLQKEIDSDANNAALWLRMGALYAIHGDYEIALEKINHAQSLDKNLTEVLLAKGRLYHKSGDLVKAKSNLDKYIKLNPYEAKGYLARSEVSAKLNKSVEAIRDIRIVCKLQTVPRPSVILDLVSLLVKIDKSDEALIELQTAISRHGKLVVFQEKQIEIHMMLQNYPEALNQIDIMLAKAGRKETLLYRRADILFKAGRVKESNTTLEKAREYLHKLPMKYRATQRMKELETSIETKLKHAS